MNYTATFLSYFGREILDGLGSPISTINYSNQISNYKYKKPTIVFSIFAQDKQSKEPVIREMRDMVEVEKLGFILVTLPVPKEQAWNRFQRSMYKLVRKGTIGFGEMNKIKIMPRKMKDYHRVQVDEANLLIRIVGPRAGPTGEGPWMPMEEEDD